MRVHKHNTIGIAGHAGHGKTAVADYIAGGQLTGVARESTSFHSGRAEILEWRPGSDNSVSLMDVPGHPRMLKNAIRGLSGADMVILVVAADDGIMPQTWEHIKIIHHLNIANGIIVLNKSDLVDPETIELAELEIQDAVCHTVLADAPVLPFSAVTGEGGEFLVSRILEIIESLPDKKTDADFRMWIDEINGISGFGTVARGVVASGTLAQDDSLWLMPLCRETRARSLEVHHRKVTKVIAGQRVGVSLPKIPLKDIQRGMILVKKRPDTLFSFLNIEITANAALKNLQRVKLYIGTSISNALMVLVDQPRLETGESGLIQFRLQQPLFALVGDAALVCGLNTHTVIGGGPVLEASNEKFRAAKSGRLIPYLTAMRCGDWKSAILCYIVNHSHRLVSLAEISRYSGIPDEDVRRVIDSLITAGEVIACNDKTILIAKTHEELADKIYRTVASVFLDDPLKKVVGRDEIRKTAGILADDAVVKFAFDDLCTKNRIVKVKGGYVLSGFTPGLNKDQRKLADILINFALNAGLLAFSPGYFCIKSHCDVRKNDAQKVLDFLNDQGEIIRLNDGHYLHATMLEDIKQRVKTAILEKGGIRLSDSMDILGYGRSNAVAVYEYLDEIGFTCRQGDERRLADTHWG